MIRLICSIIFVICGLFGLHAEAATLVVPPSSSGLVGYWPFNEGTSTRAMDYSTGGVAGVLTNIPDPATPTSGWNPGKIGGGLTLDGSNDYVDMGDADAAELTNTQSFTIAAWIYPTKSAGVGAILGRALSGGKGWYWEYNPDGTSGIVTQGLFFDYFDGSAFTRIRTGNFDVPLNQWSHVVVTKAPGSNSVNFYELYVNGVNRTGGRTSGNPSSIDYSGTSLHVGARGGAATFGGKIDDARIYSRFLSTAEIQQLYAAGAVARRQPSESGLTAYWRFDEGTSTKAIDYSGNGSTGTLTNMDATTDWVAGKFGKALDFDGTNDYVEVGEIDDLYFANTDAWTVSAWIYPTKASGIYQVIATTPTSGSFGWYMSYDNSAVVTRGVFFDYWAPNLILRLRTQNNDVPLNQWTHVSMVKSAGGSHSDYYKLYVNGVDRTTVTGAGTANSITYTGFVTRIGQKVGTGFFQGKIDDVRVYSRALSAAELTSLSQNGQVVRKAVSDSGLIGHWSFNEGTSTKAADFSGNGNIGTLSGMASPPTASSGWGPGRLGKGLIFDGTNDYVDVGSVPSTNGLSQFTISGWVKRTPGVPTLGGMFIKQTNTSNWLGLQFAATAQLNMIVSNGGLAFGTYNASPVTAFDGWHHFATVFDGTQTGNAGRLKFYLDGVEKSLSFTGTIPATTPTITASGYLGHDQQNNTFLKASMDEVRIYNRALSAAEVQTLYEMGK
jgi:large repetitive protein